MWRGRSGCSRLPDDEAAAAPGYVGGLRRELTRALRIALALLGAVWRWLDSLDIPLSPLQWALCFYAAFGVIYLFSTPVMEASDEIWHFGYVLHLRETGELPVQDLSQRDTFYGQHGSQPPLYYWAMATVTAPFDLDKAAQYRQLNPHVLSGKPAAYGNKNLVLRDDGMDWLDGASLAALAARGVGLALGALTIAFIYRIGALMAPQRPTVAFVAAAITGLNPMFIFVCASVNNDSLAMCLNAALVWLALRMLRNGFSYGGSLTLALLFALACLTKVTSLLLLPALIFAALLAYRKSRDRRALGILLGLIAVCWLLICGWWVARNLALYGEPLGIITQTTLAGGRGMYFDVADLFAEYQQFRMSFWGLFGAGNIQLANVYYVLLDLATLLSVGGGVFLILQLLAISDFAYARYELAHLLTLVGALACLCIGLDLPGSIDARYAGAHPVPADCGGQSAAGGGTGRGDLVAGVCHAPAQPGFCAGWRRCAQAAAAPLHALAAAISGRGGIPRATYGDCRAIQRPAAR